MPFAIATYYQPHGKMNESTLKNSNSNNTMIIWDKMISFNSNSHVISSTVIAFIINNNASITYKYLHCEWGWVRSERASVKVICLDVKRIKRHINKVFCLFFILVVLASSVYTKYLYTNIVSLSFYFLYIWL